MFPYSEEFPPEGREINSVSFPAEEERWPPEGRLFGLCLLGDVGSAVFAHSRGGSA